MAKDEIILSFEKAEYYTLQEACDYLNLKNGINTITTKKLLKQISFYKINTFIHFRMDNAEQYENVGLNIEYYGDNTIETIQSNMDKVSQYYNCSKNDLTRDKINNYLLMVHEKLTNNIAMRLLDEIYMGNLLFLVNEWTIENMALSINADSKTRIFDFDGFLTKDNLYENPREPSILKEWSINIDEKEYFATDIFNIYFELKSNNIKFLQDFRRKFPYDVCFNIRSDELVFIDFGITINDLIILHKDLMELENNIISNSPAPQKDKLETKQIKPRKGVSLKKLQAKEQAKIIAKALWNNDRDNKIKIAEMARLVYSELHDNGFNHQLPQNQESLQDWIRDIAPTYATIGGRPRNEP